MCAEAQRLNLWSVCPGALVACLVGSVNQTLTTSSPSIPRPDEAAMGAELCFLQTIEVCQLSRPTLRDAHAFVLCFGSQLSGLFHHTVVNF